ncbi:MAG TPA: hypothetical protein DDY34_16600 [Bacteroidales bacterium]|nr:hypothetical protein [Bacteroidales bacterium]
MKQFDQIFRQQAEKAFSTYNADHLAGEGWNLFVNKQKGKKRFAIVIPFWAKAASVAVIVSVGGLFLYQSFHNQPESYIAQKEFVPAPANELQIPVVSDKISLNAQLSSDGEVQDKLTVELFAEKKAAAEAVDMKDPVVTGEIKSSERVSDIPVNEYANEEKVAENILAADEKTEISPVEITDETPAGKKTSLIAGFSGMMSNIEDVMINSPGVSVGFYLEHKLTRKLSVRPGLALAKHSYSSTNVSDGKVFMNSVTSTGSMTGSVGSYENQLDMVTVEVPLNLVYTLLERGKSSLFVSAGVSTMVYLDQSFSSSFTNVYTEQKVDLASGNAYLETRSQDVNVESDEKAFSHVDYFSLTNLSAGYSLPLKKGGNMLIEPFVQLPVSDLTSFNVRIRYGGLSLKFRFGQEDQPDR